MEKFELLLKNDKIKSYNRISTLIIIINLALFIPFAINSKEKVVRIASIACAALLAVLIIIQLFFAGAKKDRLITYRMVSLYAIVIAWLAMGYWIIAIACLLLSVLYRISIRPVLILFDRDKINYSSLLMRTIMWDELSNVILKDGILTLDFKNNRILQAEAGNTRDEVSEKEFNDFCKRQLTERG